MTDTPVDRKHLEYHEEQDRKLVEQLVAIRKKKMSRAQVAAAMNRSERTVAAFEEGRLDPPLSFVRRYAAAVHASVEHLTLYWSDQ